MPGGVCAESGAQISMRSGDFEAEASDFLHALAGLQESSSSTAGLALLVVTCLRGALSSLSESSADDDDSQSLAFTPLLRTLLLRAKGSSSDISSSAFAACMVVLLLSGSECALLVPGSCRTDSFFFSLGLSSFAGLAGFVVAVDLRAPALPAAAGGADFGADFGAGADFGGAGFGVGLGSAGFGVVAALAEELAAAGADEAGGALEKNMESLDCVGARSGVGAMFAVAALLTPSSIDVVSTRRAAKPRKAGTRSN